MEQVKANENLFRAEVPLRLRPFVEILLDNVAQVSSEKLQCASYGLHRNDSVESVNRNRAAGHPVSDKECRSWEDFREK
jgi:hypothetical protein